MEDVDSFFLVVMGSIIIFMQAGFGFLEAGSIRAKNTTNILIKNFADLTFGERGMSFELDISFGVVNEGGPGDPKFCNKKMKCIFTAVRRN